MKILCIKLFHEYLYNRNLPMIECSALPQMNDPMRYAKKALFFDTLIDNMFHVDFVLTVCRFSGFAI